MNQILLGVLVAALATSLSASESEASFVFVNPEASSFWHTARSNVVQLPIDYPAEATTATLTVRGVGYEQVYSGITSSSYELTLPAATTPGTENTYRLTLSFDKGESVSALVSVIAGLGEGASGTTRCLTSDLRVWSRSDDRNMTLPVPCGTTSLTLNGEEVDTGLNGAQGFCTVSASPANLVLTVGAETYAASIVPTPGYLLFLR